MSADTRPEATNLKALDTISRGKQLVDSATQSTQPTITDARTGDNVSKIETGTRSARSRPVCLGNKFKKLRTTSVGELIALILTQLHPAEIPTTATTTCTVDKLR